MGFTLQYQRLFELFVWHDHFLAPGAGSFVPPPNAADADVLRPYSSGQFLQWSVAAESLTTIDNKGLIFKNNRYGCFVVSKTGFSTADPLEKITLLGRVTTPDFFHYTQLGFSPAQSRKGQIFYLHNRGLGPAPRMNLSRSGDYLALPNNIFPWQTRLVRLPQQTPGTDTTVTVLDGTRAGGSSLLTLDARSAPNAPEYELDCRGLPSGLYRLESPDLQNNPVTLYLGQEQAGSSVLFVIDIFLAGITGAVYDIRFNHN